MGKVVRAVGVLESNGMCVGGGLSNALVYCRNGGDIKIDYTRIVPMNAGDQQYIVSSCI